MLTALRMLIPALDEYGKRKYWHACDSNNMLFYGQYRQA